MKVCAPPPHPPHTPSAGVAMAIADTDGLLVDWNSSFYDTSGITEAHLATMSMFGLISPEQLPQAFDWVALVLRERQGQENTLARKANADIARKNGREVRQGCAGVPHSSAAASDAASAPSAGCFFPSSAVGATPRVALPGPAASLLLAPSSAVAHAPSPSPPPYSATDVGDHVLRQERGQPAAVLPPRARRSERGDGDGRRLRPGGERGGGGEEKGRADPLLQTPSPNNTQGMQSAVMAGGD